MELFILKMIKNAFESSKLKTYHSSRFLRVSGQAQQGFNGFVCSPFSFDSPSQGIFVVVFNVFFLVSKMLRGQCEKRDY